jgi:2-polyprenyl-3-methyl-5-hydroxy-6-metoxy-1,4-benzoquinol methylase
MATPAVGARADNKVYDERYFTKWYRNPQTRVHTPDAVRRKVRMVLAATEHFLGRDIQSVLDIGAGEGTWRTELRRLRPGLNYTGIDSSEYAIRRYGRRRNIQFGRFEDLSTMSLSSKYDLIVCADLLQYVATSDLVRGVRHIAGILNGLAFLESYTSGDEKDMTGDLSRWHSRSKAKHRRIFADAGLVACGMHCYVTGDIAAGAAELELL